MMAAVYIIIAKVMENVFPHVQQELIKQTQYLVWERLVITVQKESIKEVLVKQVVKIVQQEHIRVQQVQSHAQHVK